MHPWFILWLVCGTLTPAGFASALDDALAAEARLDSQRALELFLAAHQREPENPFLLQKISRQYSDLVVDQPTTESKRAHAASALAFAQRAAAIAPDDPVNALSVAISYGKLALYGDTRTKVNYTRLIRQNAERALSLDPGYAWAHHVLGRWHYEVAALGVSARVFVRLFHGGLPDASVERALVHLQRAVELEPDELNHHLELGFALAAAGELGAAQAAWVRGLAMPPRAKHDESSQARARAALERLAR